MDAETERLALVHLARIEATVDRIESKLEAFLAKPARPLVDSAARPPPEPPSPAPAP